MFCWKRSRNGKVDSVKENEATVVQVALLVVFLFFLFPTIVHSTPSSIDSELEDVVLSSSISESPGCGGDRDACGGEVPLQLTRLRERGSSRRGRGWSGGRAVATVCSLCPPAGLLRHFLVVVVVVVS